MDFDKLLFYDQLDNNGVIPGGVSAATPPEFNNKFFFDSGVGINAVLGSFMIGGAVQHLNKPNESFTGTNSALPMRINSYMSYKFMLDRYDNEESPWVIPPVVFYSQAKVRSVSAGFQVKRRGVNAGLWYRGEGMQKDPVVFSLIFDLFVKWDYYDKVRLGFNHDATVSKLGYGSTTGTTEGALSYEKTFPGSSADKQRYRNNNHGSKRSYDFY